VKPHIRPLSLLLFFVYWFFTAHALAQSNAHQPVQRDIAAIEVLQRALGAMGSPGVIANVRSVLAAGTLQADADSPPRTFIWKDALIGQRFEFRKELSGPSGNSVLVSGGGHSQLLGASGRTRNLPSHVATAIMPFYVPALVLNEQLSEQKYSITLVENTSPNQPLHIRITDSEDDEHSAVIKQDWFFDHSTALPVRVEYLLPSVTNALDSDLASATFSDFSVIDGIAVPLHLEVSENGTIVAHVTLTSLSFNSGVSPSDFEARAEDAR
jgi:hypothetical protein